MMKRQIQLKEFAERVERVCDFFINQAKEESDNSADVKVLLNLKEDAADIQYNRVGIQTRTLKGLREHMGSMADNSDERPNLEE